jgi:methyltransferase (TIGR00027 family)
MWQDRPSTTAQLIALSAVAVGRDRRLAPLLPAGAERLSERFLGAVAPRKLRAVRLPAVRWLGSVVERLLLPGIQAHYAARKRYIEAAVREFVERGGRRVVVLGAGFDTLAARLAPEYPHVEFVELDRPATQSYKRRAFDPPANLDFRPVDLGRPDALAGCGGPACFVAEGLTMYLRPEAVAALLRSCAETGGPGSVVVFTFLMPDARGRPRFHDLGPLGASAVGTWLRGVGEPFRWGIAVDELPDFLAPLGLRVRETVGATELRERHVVPLGVDVALPTGEAICVSEVVGC